MGGYVNKDNGLYYYHAYAQTDQYKNNHITKEEREVQTYEYVTRSTKMNREFGTQMEFIGLFIDKRQDKELIAKPYFDHKDWNYQLEQVVTYLQKRMRGFFARNKKREYKEAERKKKEAKEHHEEEERKQEEIKNKSEIERRMHPKSSEDFRLLKGELDQWVKNETIRIKFSNLNTDDKTLALQELLHKEISLLQTIEKLKISANKENKTEKISKFLASMSADKIWIRHDGHPIYVETPLTKTAEKLEEQFKKLNSSTSVDIRLKNLHEFKKLMEGYYHENKCILIEEIIALIERESDMLQRGRPDSSLQGLRHRLNNLYLSFIEVPKFNPEAGRRQIIPKNYLQNLYTIGNKNSLK